jgi:hypothetical protein
VAAALCVCAVAAAVAAFVRQSDVDAGIDHRSLVRGLWSRVDAPTDDKSPVAFYYFHEAAPGGKESPGGKDFHDGDVGLYRYGRAAHNTTHSYTFSVDGDALIWRYNKTGVVEKSRFAITGSGDDRVLVVELDPQTRLREAYRYVPVSVTSSFAPDLEAQGGADGRMWTRRTTYENGELVFSMYQLRGAGLDGRGTGWHHVGDFSDWSTEALSYRLTSSAFDVTFSLRSERWQTPARVTDDEGKRSWTLDEDPRGFWARHTYADEGPSFGSFGLLR